MERRFKRFKKSNLIERNKHFSQASKYRSADSIRAGVRPLNTIDLQGISPVRSGKKWSKKQKQFTSYIKAIQLKFFVVKIL